MKHIKIIILLLCCYTQNAIGQNSYIPLNLNNTCYWINHYTRYDPILVCEGDILTYVEKDTIINSLTYHLLRSKILDETIACTNNQINFKNTTIYLREDTIQKKLYRLYDGPLFEIPYIDYNLSVSDVIQGCIPYSIIDSINYTTVNNVVRKSQWFNVPTIGISRTIEGIGSTISFPFCMNNTGMGYTVFELKCYKKDGQLLYSKNVNDTCYTSFPVNILPQQENQIVVSFFQNTLSISNVKSSINVSVYSMTGKKIFNAVNLTSDTKINLTNNLASGLYTVIINDGKKQSVQKIIISN